MKYRKSWLVFSCCAVFTAGSISGQTYQAWIDNKAFKSLAVHEGHAEFYLDEDFNKQWRWLPACKNLINQFQELYDQIRVNPTTYNKIVKIGKDNIILTGIPLHDEYIIKSRYDSHVNQ